MSRWRVAFAGQRARDATGERVAGHDWGDPLDPEFSLEAGQRWNPPGGWPTLYLNEDVATARLGLQEFMADWPYEPEDLRSLAGPHLAVAALPRRQHVADAHTPEGVAALGLPDSYPMGPDGCLLPHEACQPIGRRIKDAGPRGVLCRSARAPNGSGRDLACFPATARSRATLVERLAFDDWFWG